MKKILVACMFLWLTAGVAIAAPTEEEPLQFKGPENAAKTTFQIMEDGKLLVAVTDAEEKPIKGLTVQDFSIRKGIKTARILSVETLKTNKAIGLNIILVVDNSRSMKMRNAIAPLTHALRTFYSTLRPIDTVTAVVFDDKNTINAASHALHAKVLQTNSAEQLSAFLAQSMDSGLTEGTYLNDAMLAGLELARQMPDKDNKFMAVFSDGEDINSSVTQAQVTGAAEGIPNFSAFTIDYMPHPEMDPFLAGFSAKLGGRAWKAASASELLPVFEAFSSVLLYRYVVAYRFLEAPTGTVAFAAPALTIEEITTIDSAPLLNHIYFAAGQGELPDRYALFENQEKTAGFNEKELKGPIEKYSHVLNIIGSRLRMHPDAGVRLVGCNSNVGIEKGRTDLSRSRAEAVRAYLRYVWGIDPQRMAVESRNLPEKPSTNRVAEGQAENQRVEIISEDPAILDTVDSAYVQKVSDLGQLRLVPQIRAEAAISDWQVHLTCGEREIQTLQGQGPLPGEWSVPLQAALLEDLSSCENLSMRVQATDTEANALNQESVASLPVHYLKRTEQMSQVQGYKVKEQYALILFDYDSAAIKARNEIVMRRIIARVQQVPNAAISIVGHTDTIGGEAYNIKLSERRAQAVRQLLLNAVQPAADQLTVTGAGPSEPMYDNGLPEGRSLNRTVTITLEYLQK